MLKKLTMIVISFALILSCSVMMDPVSAASKPAKVTGIRIVKRTTSSVTLKWKKVKRAKKYQIKYKKAGSKKYKRLITKKKKLTIKKLSPGCVYVFKIRARNSKYGKFSKTVRAETKAKSKSNRRKKAPKGVAVKPELTINGKTIKVGESISSVNKKFKLEKAGIQDTGEYPWNVYEPYSDNFLMVRVKAGKVWGFYTSSRKFSCKSWDKTIKFGDSYEKGQAFSNNEDIEIEVGGNTQVKYHVMSLVVNSIYYDADTGEVFDENDTSNQTFTKAQLSGAETIAEYTFNQLRYNQGRVVLDTSQSTTAGKVCKRWTEEWVVKKTEAHHFGEGSAQVFIDEIIKKEFPGFLEAVPADVCMATSKDGRFIAIDCGTIYANCTTKEKASPGHYADVMMKLDGNHDFRVLSITIGKDPGGNYNLHSIAAFW